LPLHIFSIAVQSFLPSISKDVCNETFFQPSLPEEGMSVLMAFIAALPNVARIIFLQRRKYRRKRL
jgi:hypothetical protein